jgi:integrase
MSRHSLDLTSPAARRRLRPLPKSAIYWVTVAEGQHLGYRKYADGPGSWWARFYLGARKYSAHHHLGSADDLTAPDGGSVLSYRDALTLAAEWWREERYRRAAGAGPAPPYTVSDACRDYLSWFREHRKGIARTEDAIRRDILPELGELFLVGAPERGVLISRPVVRSWHQAIARRPAKLRARAGEIRTRELVTEDDIRKRRATANRILTVLKAALNFAVEEGRVPKATADTWNVSPFKGADQPKVRHLDQDEARRLLRSLEDVDADLRVLAEAALHTGCAYGELIALRIEDYLRNVGGVQVVDGKTHARRRVIYLGDEGVAFFDAQTAGRSPAEPIFLRKGKHWTRSGQDRPLRQACDKAGISPAIGFHILRHTYASLYLMSPGADLPGLAKQLGHADTRMTLRHYAHLAESWRAEQAQRHAPRLGLQQPRVVRFRERTSAIPS